MINSWSPRAWPRLSLTILKRSRSTNSIAHLVAPVASPSNLSASERKWRRLGSEVTGSYMPSAWAFSIEARTSANKAVDGRRELGHATCATAGGAGETRSPSSTASSRSRKRGQRAGAFAVGPLRGDVADQKAEGAGDQRGDDLLVELGDEQEGDQRKQEGGKARCARQDRVADLLRRASFHIRVRASRAAAVPPDEFALNESG